MNHRSRLSALAEFKAGDVGETSGRHDRGKHRAKGQVILYEDRDILVIDKPAGLLTMGTDREKLRTAYYRLTDYVRKGNPKSRERIYIVHRLDREVSGILVFARSVAAKNALQSQWARVEKHYLALVYGVPPKPEGTFSSHLVESGVHRVHSTSNPKLGKLSHTAYKLLRHSRDVSLLDINLLTGRKHQIRVHLAENDLPIVGDKKYGGKRSDESRLALHAKSIAFDHPHTGERCFFETETPQIFS
jgi:tRNA pseudouridine32 synthase/23S rRNA pseudouridine746 synthase/23S rRNA pseudouridine1911/1915/1917 synthase